ADIEVPPRNADIGDHHLVQQGIAFTAIGDAADGAGGGGGDGAARGRGLGGGGRGGAGRGPAALAGGGSGAPFVPEIVRGPALEAEIGGGDHSARRQIDGTGEPGGMG